MPAYHLVFGGIVIALVASPGAAQQLSEFLFGALLQPAGPQMAACCVKLVQQPQEPFLTFEEAPLPGGPPPRIWTSPTAELAPLILGHLTRQFAARCTAGALLHSAAVALCERAVLLPAHSSAGKTLLTAWLLAQGWRYLSDEMVSLQPDLTISGFLRPLNVKTDGLSALQSLAQPTPHCGDTQPSLPEIWQVAGGALCNPGVFGAGMAGPASLRGAGIIFPRFHADAPYSLRPLTPSEAGLRLAQSLLNGSGSRPLPGDSFHTLSRLAASLPAWQLEYGSFAQLDCASFNNFLRGLAGAGER